MVETLDKEERRKESGRKRSADYRARQVAAKKAVGTYRPRSAPHTSRLTAEENARMEAFIGRIMRLMDKGYSSAEIFGAIEAAKQEGLNNGI